MFIVPMDAAGVTVRGLRQISGEAEFNEVFFDDVPLDADAVVGGVGNGWGTALTTLMFERVTIGLGGEGFGYNSARFAGAIASDEHARRDPEVRQRARRDRRASCSPCASPATARSPLCRKARSPARRRAWRR